MAEYPFPDDVRNPDRDAPNPFAEDHIDSDDGPTDAFGVTQHGDDYKPQWERTYADRARLSIGLAITGAVLSLSGWLVFVGQGLFFLLPFLSLAISIPGLTISRGDLVGMEKGAIEDKRHGLAFAAMLLGFLGVVNSLGYSIYWMYLAFMGIA